MKGRLQFRGLCVGFVGSLLGCGAWPAWVLALAGKSGVYVIRAANNKRILYVGESHTGRLKKTLMRHFQSWSGKTAGNTYGRGSVEVAVIVTKPAGAVARQNSLICQLDPRDNGTAPGCEKNGNPF